MAEQHSQPGSVCAHYHQPGLPARILAAMQAADMPPHRVSPQTTRVFDQFHSGGIESTRDLAHRAALRPDMELLDLGSGIGGPARTIAAEFGCSVTGIDLVDEYTQAARMLTEMAGLSARVKFDTGSMLALPYDGARFDAVWCQHVTMNVDDKPQLLREIRRVLRPGGVCAFHEVCAGADTPPVFPVPWATDASQNFLLAPVDFRRAAEVHGLRFTEWHDATDDTAAWFRSVPERSRPGSHPSPLGLHLLMGPAAGEKFRNVLRNLDESRIRVIIAVARA